MRKLVAALACRVNGSRLYGKPLQALDLERGLSIVEYMLDFTKSEPTIDETVIGVAAGPENDPFHRIAAARGLKSITGDETDVLQRLIQCGEAGGATDVFRITTESPFTYFEAIPRLWRRHVDNGNDVTSIAGVPDGPGFEIITLETLQRAHRHGEARHRSELCTLYVKEHRDQFKVETVEAPSKLQRLDIRLTVDYPEDLVLCRRVYEEFKSFAPRIPLESIVDYLDAHPELTELVKKYIWGERWYG